MAVVSEKFFSENVMSESPIPCDFKVGDIVKFTNEFELEFGPYRVIGFCRPVDVLYGRFIYIDYDCYWFPTEPESLSIWETNDNDHVLSDEDWKKKIS
jgi:hypothetical protein